MYVEFGNYYSPIYQGIRPHFIVWYKAPNFAGSVLCFTTKVLEYVFRPMWLRPMWPMYGTYIATLLGLALIKRISVYNMVIRA
jgi:hypothetical protein